MTKKKHYLFIASIIALIVLAVGAIFYFYLTKVFLPNKEDKIYIASDFPGAFEKMDEEVLRLTLEDLNKQYQKKKEGDHIYIRWINIGILKKRLGDYIGTEDAWQNAISS